MTGMTKGYVKGMAMALGLGLSVSGYAARSDCGDLVNPPAKPIEEVAKDDPNVQNDYVDTVEDDDRAGVFYLAIVNGASPKPNDCGLNPSNDEAAWTGWGGPLDGENVTIGEGAGTRNEIVIGGTYYVRGIGNHTIGTIVYDLGGEPYQKFEGWVGMSDEKDPLECGVGGTGDFTFSIDGKEVFKSEVLGGTLDGENVLPVFVEFDIPGSANELEIVMGDGGDGTSCDHAVVGDAKLLTGAALAVDSRGKAASQWGLLKSH